MQILSIDLDKSHTTINFFPGLGFFKFSVVSKLRVMGFLFGLFGWFLCLMAYQLFLGYLMPKPFSQKSSSGTI